MLCINLTEEKIELDVWGNEEENQPIILRWIRFWTNSQSARWGLESVCHPMDSCFLMVRERRKHRQLFCSLKRVWRSARTAMSSLGCLSSPEPDSVLSAGWERWEHQNQMWDPTRSGSDRIRNHTLLLADDSPAATGHHRPAKAWRNESTGDFQWVSYKYNT